MQSEPETSLDVFTVRRTWKAFPAEFLEALATKLQSVEKAKEFVALCEDTEILANNIVKFAHQDPAFAIGSAAATLTSYANAMGEQRKFHEAKRALEFAMLLRPRHLPAWISMALVTVNLNDLQAAVAWADKVLNFKSDPNTDDPWEAGAQRMMTPDGERQATDALRNPEIVGGFAKIREQMNAIKELCRGNT